MSLGDHVFSHRKGYTHHGIDLGDGRVVHYSGLAGGLSAGPVEIITRAVFAQGGAIHVRSYTARKFDAATTVERALARVGENCYSVFGNNCEHFACWCITGEHTSGQCDRGVSVGAALKTAGAATGAVSMVSSAGAVSGLSGPGIMSGLAAIGPGGAVGGIVTMAAGAGVGAALLLNNTVLADNPALDQREREARQVGRYATVAGAGTAAAGGVAAVSAMGVTAGLSGAGIMSGLAAIGTSTGAAALSGASAAVAGTAVVVAAPVVLAVSLGYGLYKIWRWL